MKAPLHLPSNYHGSDRWDPITSSLHLVTSKLLPVNDKVSMVNVGLPP